MTPSGMHGIFMQILQINKNTWDYNKSQMRTSVALTQTCYAIKVNFAFDLLPFQNNLQDLSIPISKA
jgi:hypothetical protein